MSTMCGHPGALRKIMCGRDIGNGVRLKVAPSNRCGMNLTIGPGGRTNLLFMIEGQLEWADEYL